MINRSELEALINSSFPDNDNQEITASVMRSFQTSFAESTLNLISDNQVLGLGSWSSSGTYLLGQSVVHNNFIYQATASVTTTGSFITSEWSPISTYINTTAGLSAYQLITNAISLDDSKLIPTVTTDTDFTNNVTGFYKVEGVTVTAGLTETYPVLGKALLTILKRTIQAESLIFFYPLSDLSSYYVKKVNGNWTKVSSGVDYTFTKGLTNSSNTITLGGNFDVTSLTGSDISTSTFTINNASAINLTGTSINLTGDVYLPNSTLEFLNGNTTILALDTETKRAYEIDVASIATNLSVGSGIKMTGDIISLDVTNYNSSSGIQLITTDAIYMSTVIDYTLFSNANITIQNNAGYLYMDSSANKILALGNWGQFKMEQSVGFLLTDTYSNSITSSSSGITLTSTKYVADYSSTYTNRSLVDKEYVSTFQETITRDGRFDYDIVTSGSPLTGSGTMFWSSVSTGINSAMDVSGFGTDIQSVLNDTSKKVTKLTFDFFLIVELSGSTSGYGQSSLTVQGPFFAKDSGGNNQPTTNSVLYQADASNVFPTISTQFCYQRVELANPTSLPHIVSAIRILPSYDIGTNVEISKISLVMFNIVMTTQKI